MMKRARQAAASLIGRFPDLREAALAQLPGRDRLVRLLNGSAAEHLPHAVSSLGHRLWCRYREIKPLATSLRDETVCLFAHYDRDGLIEDYVLHHLACLRAAGVITILVSTALLRPEESAKAAPYCAAIIERDNIGLDFGSWRTALLAYPQIAECETLLFANDSVYGPMGKAGNGDLRRLIDRMAATGCDFWAVTESLQVRRHYQSYFLGFRKSCLRSAAFRRYCEGIQLLTDKDAIIHRYEIGLRKELTDAGLRGEALIPATPTTSALAPKPNPTLHRWREGLAAGSPFVKVQLLRENPHSQPIGDWPEVVASYGYDPELIRKHLRRFGRSD